MRPALACAARGQQYVASYECAPLPSLSLSPPPAGETASEIHHTRRVTILSLLCISFLNVEKFSLARRRGGSSFFTVASPSLAKELQQSLRSVCPMHIFGPAHAAASLTPTNPSKFNSKMTRTPRSEKAAYMRSTASLLNGTYHSPRDSLNSLSFASAGSELPAPLAGAAHSSRMQLSPSATSYRLEDGASSAREQSQREVRWDDSVSTSYQLDHSPSWLRYNRDDSLNMNLVSVLA